MKDRSKGRRLAGLIQWELNRDREKETMASTKDNSFRKHWFKLRVSENYCIILKNIHQFGEDVESVDIYRWHKIDGFRKILEIIRRFVLTKIEIILGLGLVCIFSFKEGVVAILFVCTLALLLFVENRPKNANAWRVIYLLFMGNLFLQFLIQLIFDFRALDGTEAESIEGGPAWPIKPSSRLAGAMVFLYGAFDVVFDLTVLLLFEVMFLHVAPNLSGRKLDLARRENCAESVYRMSANNGWKALYNSKAKQDQSELRFLRQQHKAALNWNKESSISRWITAISKKTEVYKYFASKFEAFLELTKRCALMYNRDRRKMLSDRFASFWWRNFSFRMRKGGVDLESPILLTLSLILIFFFVCFHDLTGDPEKGFSSIILHSKVPGTLGVNFTFLLLAICLERFMYSRINDDWAGGTKLRSEQIRKKLKTAGITHRPSQKAEDALGRFRMNAKKIINGRRFLELLKPQDAKSEYRVNPLLSKFVFSLCIYAYLTMLVFVWMPLVGVRLSNSDTGVTDALLCNDKYRSYFTSGDKKILTKARRCNNFFSNAYLQVLFLLSNVYLLLNCLQAKWGYSALRKIKYSWLSDIWEITRFFMYKYTPFIREIRTVIDYTAADTALNIFQWIKLEDVETCLKSARVMEKFNSHSGRLLNKHLKRLLGGVFFGFFFLLLTLPLYLFSDIIPSGTVDEVQRASLTAYAWSDNIRLQIFENNQFRMQGLERHDWLGRSEKLKMFESGLYRQVSINRFSEHYFEATPEMLKLLRQNISFHSKVKVEINLTFETRYKGELSKKFWFGLSQENGSSLLAALAAGECMRNGAEEMVLGQANRLVRLKELDKDFTEEFDALDFDDLNFLFMLKWSCDSQSTRPFFRLSTETSFDPEFLVLQENITNSVEFLAKFSNTSNLSIISIYAIIFSYIGLTVIRNAFFGISHRIWTLDIPTAHKLEETYFLIMYSRVIRDFFAETRFYYQLIDLFRAPERIKRITGPFARRSEKRRLLRLSQINET